MTSSSQNSFSVCLTHDVDWVKKRHQCLTHFIRTGRFYHLKSLFSKENTYWNFNTIMDIEKSFNVHSTFFFLCQEGSGITPSFFPSPHSFRYSINNSEIKNILNILEKGGWEVGLHASYNSYNSEDLLSQEKTLLENVLGHKVSGVRQHHARLSGTETWKLQQKVGFKYDCSLFYPQSNLPTTRTKIHYPFKDDFVTIPTTIMDTHLLKEHSSFENSWDFCLESINQAALDNGLLTLLWHQRSFNENEFPGAISLYTKIIEECKKRDAHFLTAQEVQSNGIL